MALRLPMPTLCRMFLRCNRRKKDGKDHEYWSVVENRRLGDGRVVQRQVLYLGEINASQREAWCKTIEIDDEGRRRQVSLLPAGSIKALARVESRYGAVAVGLNIAVAAPFGWRCPMSQTMAPFPHPAHRTEQAICSHSALGQALMLSPTEGCGCEAPV